MTGDDIEARKAELRKQAHEQRAALAHSAREDAAREIARHFFDSVTLSPTDVVAAYWRIRDEVDCEPILVKLMDRGQPVCLPAVIGPEEPLELRLWVEGEPLYPAGFGTLAPSELAPRVEPDVILMPLLGFDRLGTRLGYGGGYYDRTLARMCKAPRLIGLAYAGQQIGQIPRDGHDVPLDMVITEAGPLHFDRTDNS